MYYRTEWCMFKINWEDKRVQQFINIEHFSIHKAETANIRQFPVNLEQWKTNHVTSKTTIFWCLPTVARLESVWIIRKYEITNILYQHKEQHMFVSWCWFLRCKATSNEIQQDDSKGNRPKQASHQFWYFPTFSTPQYNTHS